MKYRPQIRVRNLTSFEGGVVATNITQENLGTCSLSIQVDINSEIQSHHALVVEYTSYL